MSLKLPRNWDFSAFRAESAKIARSKSVMPGEGSPASCRPGSPRTLERPLKTGWLKKQRSIVKNWQARYFVLRGHTLYYHKDDKDSSCQGSISLKSTQVNELPSNADEQGKFLFEIIPGNGDRERDPCVLMANSQNEMEEWVRAIRRVLGAQSSGAVFGRSLSETIAHEQRFGPRLVPILVQKCADFIREHGLNEEGIFRLPGQDNQVKQFRDAFDAGERPSFPSDTDVHTVASLLKLYLRELPEPVVPCGQYQSFLDCTHQLNPNGREGRDALEMQISFIPKANYNLLSYVCRFLNEVQLNSKVNKMSVENLATVFGVNLLKPQIEDPVTMMKSTPQIQKLMTAMIRQHEELFPPSKDVTPPPPSKNSESKASAPRSFVGWDSADFCSASPDILPLSEVPEEDDARTLGSVREEGEGSEAAVDTPASCIPPCSSATDPWSGSGSPRKRTHTLPASTCSYPSRGTRGGDMLSPMLSLDEGNQRGTFSEDIFEILGLQNLTPSERAGSAGKGTCRGTKDAMPTQVTPPEGAGSAGKGGCGGTRDAIAIQVTPPDRRRSSSSSSSSGSSLVLSQSSREESLEACADAKKPKEQPERQQSSQDSPEDRISSLLQKNSELTAMVKKLQAALEAEKRHREALEIRLRNAEQSHDEAQRRNRGLDREIQEFLPRPRGGPP
ncbi:rho GTPase-activating protein 25 [Paramormyrops kingsleyae]|uniref:rho GTPase-activating protein 25 n=1 Tax=Paramormyrops kingsleyae TaxID=1676925 RepID=UPI003B975BE9